MTDVRRSLAGILVGLAGLAFVTTLGAQGTMVHTLEAFYAPSAAVVLPDHRTVLVANTGRGEYGLTAGRGCISRVTIGDDGQITVDQLRFITNLNGPVGLTLLHHAVGELPAETLVVTVGGSWMVDEAGRPLADDDARRTGLALFDATTGEPRGRVLLGTGSKAAQILGHPVSDPADITSDAAGNIYLIDVDAATTRSQNRAQANAGVIKISSAALAALLRDELPAADGLRYAVEHSLPTALTYDENEDALYWGTFGGELRRVPHGDMSGRTAVDTVSKRVGTVACLGVTLNGTIYGATADGALMRMRGNRSRVIRFHDEMRFLSPGKPALIRSPGGQQWIILPEQGGGGVGPWRQRLNVIAVPGDL